MSQASLHLRAQRLKIDLVDSAVRRLLRVRQSLIEKASGLKREQGLPIHDVQREQFSARLARWHARQIGVDEQHALAVLELNQCEARKWQHQHSDKHSKGSFMQDRHSVQNLLLSKVPPPRRWAPVLKALPHGLIAPIASSLIQSALADAYASGKMDVLQGRTVGIHIKDLDLIVAVRVSDAGTVVQIDAQAEALICGSLTDLLLLASRLEDADTLFFQRRIELSGDTELGLLARNLLDQIEWESIPLALRILLVRAARFAHASRDANRSAGSPVAAAAP